MKYSVLLLYPDHAAENYGEETYLAWVETTTPEDAILAAQLEAQEANNIICWEDVDDFLPLLVVQGHIVDVNPRLQRKTAQELQENTE